MEATAPATAAPRPDSGGIGEELVPTDVKFMPYAVRNLTEFPLCFAANPAGVTSSHEATALLVHATPVAPKATVPFEAEELSGSSESSSAFRTHGFIAGRSTEGAEAATINCDELVDAAKDGDEQLVYELLQRRADVNSTRAGNKAKVALHEAAKYKHYDVLVLLLNAGADFEVPTNDKHQMRPLHYAARAGHLPCVRQLLDVSADPTATTADGLTPKSFATQAPEVARLLQEALELTVRQSSERRFATAELVDAAKRGNMSRVRSLLVSQADPESTDGSMTALQRACSERQHDVAQELLLAKASVDSVAGGALGGRGLTALHYAARFGPLKLVSLLVEYGANPASLCPDGTLPLDKVTKLHTRDCSKVRDYLHRHLLLEANKTCPPDTFVRLSDDRKKARAVFCVMLPTQLCFYADAQAASQLKGHIDLTEVERVRWPCKKPASEAMRPTWARKTDQGHELLDERSVEIVDATQTTVLYAESLNEARRFASVLGQIAELQCELDSQTDLIYERSSAWEGTAKRGGGAAASASAAANQSSRADPEPGGHAEHPSRPDQPRPPRRLPAAAAVGGRHTGGEDSERGDEPSAMAGTGRRSSFGWATPRSSSSSRSTTSPSAAPTAASPSSSSSRPRRPPSRRCTGSGSRRCSPLRSPRSVNRSPSAALCRGSRSPSAAACRGGRSPFSARRWMRRSPCRRRPRGTAGRVPLRICPRSPHWRGSRRKRSSSRRRRRRR